MTQQKGAELCADLLTARVSGEIAVKYGIQNTDALKKFMSTKTYDLLTDFSSRLYECSTEYVIYMLDAEENNDWERWLKI